SNQIAYLEAATHLTAEPPGFGLAFAPVIDGVVRSDRADRLVAAGSADGVDLIVGSTAEEYRLFIWGMPEAMRAMVPVPNIADYFGPLGRAADEVAKIYAAARPGAQDIDLASAVATDGIFGIPAVRLAEAQLARHDNVRMYQFAWRSPVLDGMLG